ncbi:MAG: hypothetical protein AAFV36_04105 [Myxococcota bacterium]
MHDSSIQFDCSGAVAVIAPTVRGSPNGVSLSTTGTLFKNVSGSLPCHFPDHRIRCNPAVGGALTHVRR